MTATEQCELSPFGDEHRAFFECIDDILRAVPGLHYHTLRGQAEIRSRDKFGHAAFAIETNPRLDLTVSILIDVKDFRLQINGIPFDYAKGELPFERWMDRCSRLVLRLVTSDFEIEVSRMLILSSVTTLWLRRRQDSRRKIGQRHNPLVAILAWFMPWFAITTERSWEYPRWYCLDAETHAEKAE